MDANKRVDTYVTIKDSATQVSRHLSQNIINEFLNTVPLIIPCLQVVDGKVFAKGKYVATGVVDTDYAGASCKQGMVCAQVKAGKLTYSSKVPNNHVYAPRLKCNGFLKGLPKRKLNAYPKIFKTGQQAVSKL